MKEYLIDYLKNFENELSKEEKQELIEFCEGLEDRLSSINKFTADIVRNEKKQNNFLMALSEYFDYEKDNE